MKSSSAFSSRTALVLGGGGSTGNAWLIGVIAGLADAGLDVSIADLIVGTSAGSTAAAQITGERTARLYESAAATLVVTDATAGPSRPLAAAGLERTQRIIDASADPCDMRRRMGAAAIERAAAMEGASARWRATVASRLPSERWPAGLLLITAVDADTGEPVVFDRGSDVDLVDAVAASCSSGFAYTIGDRRYIDGGYRTNAENADLASGCARVLVLSPFGGRTLTPERWGLGLEAQVDALRAAGSEVETIAPGRASEHLFGVNGMELALRPAAARAGQEDGVDAASRLAEFWSA